MKVPSAIAKLKQAVCIACRVIGLRPDQVVVIPGGISIADYEMSVLLMASGDTRIWRAVERRFVRMVGGEDELKEYETILFEERLGREMTMAKRLAMRIAEARVDLAIDQAS